MRKLAAFAAVLAMALAACADDGGEPTPEDIDTPAGEDRADAATDDTGDTAPSPGPESDDGAPGSDELAQGQWYAKTERGVPMALFGPPQTEANLVVRCEGENLVFIRSASIKGEAEMELRAGGETRTITARTRPGPLEQTAGELAADDPFAATLARTAQPIAVRLEDGPFYRVPSHAHLRGVVANCRES